jgi:hypothetical protein
VTPSLVNVFDVGIGSQTYAGDLNNSNWVSSFAGLNAHSGNTFFASANGNAATDFVDIGFDKPLGGAIAFQSYNISLFMAKYQDSPQLPLNGVPFTDFSELKVGGVAGLMTWLTTPTPTQNAEWVEWKGVYTPSPSDVGQPFVFRARWTERARTSIAIDGLVTAVPVPEPAASVMLGVLLAAMSSRKQN